MLLWVVADIDNQQGAPGRKKQRGVKRKVVSFLITPVNKEKEVGKQK
jgi:hypothetical protein